MSVLSYLQRRAAEAVLSSNENSSIQSSISTLQSRLKTYFGNDLTTHFRFGSQTRGTILPRAMDEHSDVDYMIVFSEGGYTPQTYINRLRKFAEYYYQSSEIKQSSPTVVLSLNHIKFDLVPALSGYWTGVYRIPNGTANWQETNPNEFNATLTSKNQSESNLIKPTIRLAKYWNAKSGYVFDSFTFEQWIVSQYYFLASNQKDYLFSVIDKLTANELTQWKNDQINRAKQIVAKVREYETSGMPVNAEIEVKKLIPE